MKGILAALVGLALGAGGFLWYMQRERKEQAAVAPPRTASEAQECRDACEQNAIVSRYDNEWLKRCRAGCGEVTPRPREPIQRITVAPADHRVDPRFAPPPAAARP
jgi:hypothetical protein